MRCPRGFEAPHLHEHWITSPISCSYQAPTLSFFASSMAVRNRHYYYSSCIPGPRPLSCCVTTPPRRSRLFFATLSAPFHRSPIVACHSIGLRLVTDSESLPFPLPCSNRRLILALGLDAGVSMLLTAQHAALSLDSENTCRFIRSLSVSSPMFMPVLRERCRILDSFLSSIRRMLTVPEPSLPKHFPPYGHGALGCAI